ncbi:MAG: 30S ribosomal protein S6 [Clostridia bacterium]|nr:30S ribosomal protein S6 [Clostridia bacterium]
MDNTTHIYETMFVVNTTVDESVTKATVEKFTSLIASNGETLKVTDMGKRRLAYPIDDMTEGYYTVVCFSSEPDFPRELERLYNIDENVMRSIVLRLEAAPAPDPVVETKEEETVSEEPAAEEAVAETTEETAPEQAEESAEEPKAEEPVEETAEEPKAETAE